MGSVLNIFNNNSLELPFICNVEANIIGVSILINETKKL